MFGFTLGAYITRLVTQFNGGKFFTYYTNWAWLTLTVYFFVLTCKYVRFYYGKWREARQRKNANREQKNEEGEEDGDVKEEMENTTTDATLIIPTPTSTPLPASSYYKLSWTTRLAWILFDIAVAQAVFLDLVAWIVLSQYSFTEDGMESSINFWTITMHGLNVLIVLIEFFLGWIPYYLPHTIFAVLFTTLYQFFTYIYYWASGSGTWIYPFLDWNAQDSALINLGVVALFIFSLFLLVGLHKLKDRIPPTKGRKAEVEHQLEMKRKYVEEVYPEPHVSMVLHWARKVKHKWRRRRGGTDGGEQQDIESAENTEMTTVRRSEFID